MKLTFTKTIGTDFVFSTEIPGSDFGKAWKTAVDTDAVFELHLDSDTNSGELICRLITLESLTTLLSLDKDKDKDKETIDILTGCFTSSTMNENHEVSVSHLSISCSGRVKLSINAPEIDSKLVFGQNNASLKIGLGFTFQADHWSIPEDIKCTEEKSK